MRYIHLTFLACLLTCALPAPLPVPHGATLAVSPRVVFTDQLVSTGKAFVAPGGTRSCSTQAQSYQVVTKVAWVEGPPKATGRLGGGAIAPSQCICGRSWSSSTQEKAWPTGAQGVLPLYAIPPSRVTLGSKKGQGPHSRTAPGRCQFSLTKLFWGLAAYWISLGALCTAAAGCYPVAPQITLHLRPRPNLLPLTCLRGYGYPLRAPGPDR